MILSPYVAPGVIRQTDLTIGVIIDAVCKYFNCKSSIIYKQSRKAEIIEIRHIVIYLSRNQLHLTYGQIGTEFSKDHATIINSCKRIENRIETEPEFAKKIIQILSIVNLKKLGI